MGAGRGSPAPGGAAGARERLGRDGTGTAPAVLLWRRDGDTFRLAELNDAAATLTGWQRDSMLGHSVDELAYDPRRVERDLRHALDYDAVVERSAPSLDPATGAARRVWLRLIKLSSDLVLIEARARPEPAERGAGGRRLALVFDEAPV